MCNSAYHQLMLSQCVCMCPYCSIAKCCSIDKSVVETYWVVDKYLCQFACE